jgi:membrane protease YdiL (CAAX protease family)
MNIFINRTERRLRAGWRLLIHLGLNYFGLGVIRLLPVFAMAAVLMLLGQLPFSPFSDSRALSQAMLVKFQEQPVLLLLARLLMLPLLLGVYALLAKLLDRRRWGDYGLRLSRPWWRDFTFGLSLGGVLMASVFLVEWALGWVKVTAYLENRQPEYSTWFLLGLALINYVFVGVSEELFSRGYQLRNLAEGLNLPRIGKRGAVIIAYIVTSSFFGLMHLGNANASWVSSVNIALAGLMLGLGFVLTGDLAIPIGLHISWNFFQGNVFGFPVSGGDNGLALIGVQQLGPVAWTGGAFGPEGGLVGVIAMLLSLAAIWGWVRWTRGRAALQTGLAEYTPAKSGKEQAAPELAGAEATLS